MPLSVCKKASANASTLRHVKNGLQNRDIFANQDGEPNLTCGILSVTNHENGPPVFKTPSASVVIVTEGEMSFEDAAKSGEISVLKPGDVIRIDKGTTVHVSSPTAGKAYYVNQSEFGIKFENYLA